MVLNEAGEAGRSLGNSPVDLGGLSSFFAAVPELRDRLPIQRIDRIGRGQSNLTFRVWTAAATVIMRRPPYGPLPPRAHDVLREYHVIDALQQSAVPVPRAIAACRDPSLIGAPFFLMEDLPGDAIRSSLPPALRSSADAPRAISEGAVDALAALHTIAPSAVGLETLSKPAGYVERQVVLWKRQLDYARVRPVPDLDWVTQWLERHIGADVSAPCVVHGDYKLDNVIFSAAPPVRVLGVVDWELAALGDPLADLGWLLAFWCQDGTPPRELSILPRATEESGFLRREDLAQRYAERTGRSLPGLRFYVVLALWKMGVLLEAHWARHTRQTAHGFDFAYLERGGPIFHSYIRRTAEDWNERSAHERVV